MSISPALTFAKPASPNSVNLDRQIRYIQQQIEQDAELKIKHTRFT